MRALFLLKQELNLSSLQRTTAKQWEQQLWMSQHKEFSKTAKSSRRARVQSWYRALVCRKMFLSEKYRIKIRNLGLQSHQEKFVEQIQILSTDNVFCQKFAAVCLKKSQFSVPLISLTRRPATPLAVETPYGGGVKSGENWKEIFFYPAATRGSKGASSWRTFLA